MTGVYPYGALTGPLVRVRLPGTGPRRNTPMYLSLRQAAHEAGVSKTTISNIENGQSEAYPSTIRKLARALDVTPSELVRQD